MLGDLEDRAVILGGELGQVPGSDMSAQLG